MTDPTHVMIDLETLGTDPDAVILSIGAVSFHPHHEGVEGEFHARVDLASALRAGLTVTAGTIEWWMTQDRTQARQALLALPAVPLDKALRDFVQWFGPSSRPIWGNGAAFDNVILRSAFDRAGIACPWSFWDDRCYRTVKMFTPVVPLARSGLHHDALDDARSQALHLQAIIQQKGLTL